MEFKKFETPSEELRPFFRKKYRSMCRSFRCADPKLLTLDDMKKYVSKATKYVDMKYLFECVDYNGDGVIEFHEFNDFYDIFGFNTSTTGRVVFDILDADKNGTISADEFGYAKLSFLMCCGPDDPIRLFYGPIDGEE